MARTDDLGILHIYELSCRKADGSTHSDKQADNQTYRLLCYTSVWRRHPHVL